MSNEALSNLLREDRRFAPSAAFAADGERQGRRLRRGRGRPAGILGHPGLAPGTGTPRGTRRWTGRASRSPSGSSAGSSTSRTTAWTGTSRPATATASRSTSRASRATPAPSPTPSSRTRSAKAANALTELGIRQGDRVAIYMPMIPEAAIAMLACARIGAVHSVVFGGFSARRPARPHRRRRTPSCSSPPTAATGAAARCPLKANADEAVERRRRRSRTCSSCKRTRRGRRHGTRRPRRLVARLGRRRESTEHDAGAVRQPSTRCSSSTPPAPPASPRASCTPPAATSPRPRTPTTPSSTSSRRPTSTGAPPTSAGSPATPTSSTARSPTARPQVMYEGAPDTPHQGRFWEIIEKYGVTILYTAPTAIRTFMKWGDDIPAKYDLSAACGCWARSASRSTPRPGCGTARTSAATAAPIVDTWWQTETGAIMISPLPGVTATKPGSAHAPAARASSANVVDDDGNHRCRTAAAATSSSTEPWPSMLRDHLGRRRSASTTPTGPASPPGLLLRRRRRQEGRATATSGSSAASTT